MQEQLDNNDISMYSTYNEGKSVIAERFLETLKAKKVTANDSKSYLSYLNKLVDQCSNTYYHFISKKSINVYYTALTKKIETNPKDHKPKVNDRVRII